VKDGKNRGQKKPKKSDGGRQKSGGNKGDALPLHPQVDRETMRFTGWQDSGDYCG
jgi:hypothetical protein